MTRTVNSVLEVVGHRLAIKVDEVEKVSDGGIIIVTDNQEHMELVAAQTGCVVSIGPECWKAYRTINQDTGKEVNGRPWVKEGDRVFFSKYTSKFIKDPETDEIFALINDNDVIAKIVDKRAVVLED